MKKIFVWGFLLAVISISTGTMQAQSFEIPLVFSMHGDLWAWSESSSELKQLTTWGYNEHPVISPDGRYAAYNSWAQVTVEALASGMPAIGAPPSNIWIIELESGEVFRTDDQPEGAVYMTSDGFGTAIVRSTPTWSPDGDSLVWVQVVLPDFDWQIVRYDLATGSPGVIVPDLPPSFADGGLYVPSVDWGATGIVYRTIQIDEAQNATYDMVWLYDPDGKMLSNSVVATNTSGGIGGMVIDHFLVDYQGREYLGLFYSPTWELSLLDLTSGSLEPVDGPLELVNPTVDNTLGLRLGVTFDEMAAFSWTINQSETLTPLDYQQKPCRWCIGISPAGDRVAYIANGVYVWHNNQIQIIPGTEKILETTGANGAWIPAGLAWGHSAWRLLPG